ncbi:MAG: MFS transporter [Rhizobiaceae bacterium]
MRAVEVAVVLGLTTTVSYGTLYYAFGVVSHDMAADTGLSLTSVYAIFSFGLFASGFLATRAGRLLDRRDPAAVMATGSALAAALLVLWSLVEGRWAYAMLLVALQAVSMLVLYEAAFVTAARYAPATARRTITGITLIAGFASTIFWPLTDWLRSFWTWRDIYLLYAALHGAFCLPLHLWLSRRHTNGRRGAPRVERTEAPAVAPRLTDTRTRRLALILLAIGFASKAFAISALHLHLIGLLDAIGLAASAAAIGALIGPSQVAGRIVEFVMSDRLSIFAVTLFSTAAMPAALLLLVWAAPWTVAAIVFAIMFGLGQGLSYIARGVFPLELFGSHGFGALTGRINAIRLYVSAAAPFVTAAVLERAGAVATIYVIVFAGLVALVALGAIGPLLTKSSN